MELQSFFKYWGKAGEDGRYHLLPYHCLDVAAVAAVWWGSSPTIRRSFCRDSACSEKQFRAWLLFFVALHDYGKYDLRFQRKVPTVWSRLHPLAGDGLGLPSQFDSINYRHGENGLSWFKQDYFALHGYEEQPDSLFIDDGDPPQWPSWKTWIEAVTGHHGHVKQTEYVLESRLPAAVDKRFVEFDLAARQSWLTALEELFLQPVGLSRDDTPPPPSPLLAGLCSVSDWLASRCDETNFSFHQQPEQLHGYFERKLAEDAPRIFEFSGIGGTPKDYGGIQPLLPTIATPPRPLQCKIDKLPLLPGLTIVEAPTGSGKTEAALAYAWRLLADGLADAIIFALPTQATANAMLGRLETLAPNLFDDKPNLLLAHGSARFNDQFSKLKRRGLTDAGEPDGWTQCGAWLAESRKRAFFGQIGVCTIDQVLISVLPVKHRFVRGLGVGRSVLIVDEVHAYDAYMYCLLEEVLRQQRAAGGSAILLSATLPARQKHHLCATWGGVETNPKELTPYPLVTWTGECTFPPLTLGAHEQPEPVKVGIECLRLDEMEPNQDLLARLIRAAESGAQVAVICNLVNDAQRIARSMREMTSVPIDLFHARYRFKDRQSKEDNVIRRFGPKGCRDHGRVLIATQVVEQSLDIDFDWVVTQLCPIDLLFQRLGRLHRHSRKDRPEGFGQPFCTVLLPQDGNYGFTGKIYANTRVLWRTEQKLLAAPDGMVIFPAAYREWIESVYQEEPWLSESADITKAYDKFTDDLSVSRYKALQQIHSAANPFADTDEKVAAMTRDGEMGLTVIPCIESLEGRRLLDGELVTTLDEFKRPEELARNCINVPHRWGMWLKSLWEEDHDEKRYWLAMKEEGEGYMREGEKVAFRYHRDTGLERVK